MLRGPDRRGELCLGALDEPVVDRPEALVGLVQRTFQGVLGGSMWGSGSGYGFGGLGLSGTGEGGGGIGLGSIGTLGHGAGTSDVERAVIGHGAKRGPFTEGAGLKLERDAQAVHSHATTVWHTAVLHKPTAAQPLGQPSARSHG